MHFITTVKILFKAIDECDAADFMSILLSDNGDVKDWTYLTPSIPLSQFIPDLLTGDGQWTKPTPVKVSRNYEEGDLINMVGLADEGGQE